jgi:hypothetical protein
MGMRWKEMETKSKRHGKSRWDTEWREGGRE